MNQPDENQPGHVERGAAEEASGAPLTEMEREVSRPPEERWADHTDRDDDETPR